MTRLNDPDFKCPEDLPEFARRCWPDLREWPTSIEISQFRKETRRDPETRLAVLSGLRSWAVVDMSGIWAWVGAMLALATLIGSIVVASNALWIQVLAVVAFLLVGGVLLTALIGLHAKVDLRRRRATMWLRALEEATSR